MQRADRIGVRTPEKWLTDFTGQGFRRFAQIDCRWEEEIGIAHMGQMVDRMDRALYPDFGKNWDDGLFRRRVLDHLGDGKDKDMLDLGAGAGILEHMNFRGMARRVCGIDPDPRVLENRFVDDAKVGFGEEIPYEDHSFDLVFANNVLTSISIETQRNEDE